MATYQSSLVTDGIVYDEVGPKVRKASYDITAAMLAGTHVFQMIPVYKGEMLAELIVVSGDLDTNGSPTAAFTVGDGGDVDRFISTNIAGTGGNIRLEHNLGYVFPADDTIDIDLSAAAATAQAGTVTVVAILI